MNDPAPDRAARAGAKFSQDRIYRYALWRSVAYTHEVSARTCVFIGLNPSTADETVDDPTVRRCMGFALREGCGIMVLVNLFAIRATDPREMMQMLNPIGPVNNSALVHYTTRAPVPPLVIACWGMYGSHRNRDREVVHLLRSQGVELHCLGLTQEGHPRHPLYLAANTPLRPLPDYA